MGRASPDIPGDYDILREVFAPVVKHKGAKTPEVVTEAAGVALERITWSMAHAGELITASAAGETSMLWSGTSIAPARPTSSHVPTSPNDSRAARPSNASDEHLWFQTQGPHPFTWIAVPFTLVLAVLGVIGVAEVRSQGVVACVTGLVAVGLAAATLMSVAYSAWGSTEITRSGDTWTVTRRVGKIAASLVRTAEVYSPPPYVVTWPGSAGRHVRVDVEGRSRPLELGAGLCLDEASPEADTMTQHRGHERRT